MIDLMRISFTHETTDEYVTVEDMVGTPSVGDSVQASDDSERTTVHSVLWQPRGPREGDGFGSSVVVYHS